MREYCRNIKLWESKKKNHFLSRSAAVQSIFIRSVSKKLDLSWRLACTKKEIFLSFNFYVNPIILRSRTRVFKCRKIENPVFKKETTYKHKFVKKPNFLMLMRSKTTFASCQRKVKIAIICFQCVNNCKVKEDCTSQIWATKIRLIELNKINNSAIHLYSVRLWMQQFGDFFLWYTERCPGQAFVNNVKNTFDENTVDNK